MPIEPQTICRETEKFLALKVKIPGFKEEEFKDRVKITPIFFSLTLPPYLLQIDFTYEIDVHTVKCQKENHHFIFIFEKREPGIWGNFDAKPKSENVMLKRNESLRILEESISKYHVKTQQVQEDRRKMAQKAQWAVDQKIRETIEGLEQKGKENAKAEISKFLSEGPVETDGDLTSETKAVKANFLKPEKKEELPNKSEEYICTGKCACEKVCSNWSQFHTMGLRHSKARK